MTDRNQQLLAGLEKTDRIIEIGPLHGPIAPKAAGWATTVVDHATRAELIAKYAGHDGVDPSLIQDVDIVWSGGPLSAAFPAQAQGSYKALIASHVIEHVPDLVGFLDSAAWLLDPSDGVLALAVPDKRWCFDLFRPVSTTGQLLAAHRNRSDRHSPEKLFDHNAYSASDRGRNCWGREKLSDLRFFARLEDAKAAFDAWSDRPDSPYIDCHAWQFTPSSFELAILELGEIGAADWWIDWITPQPQTEFTTHLRRGYRRFASVEERNSRRIGLFKGIVREIREQSDWLLEDDGFASSSVAVQAARIGRLESDLADFREGLRPVETLLSALLPLRRLVARLRGRV